MLGGIFDRKDANKTIETFDRKIIEKNFWKDKLSAQKILKEKNFFENIFENFNSTVNEIENLEQLLELAENENNILVIKDCEIYLNKSMSKQGFFL